MYQKNCIVPHKNFAKKAKKSLIKNLFSPKIRKKTNLNKIKIKFQTFLKRSVNGKKLIGMS